MGCLMNSFLLSCGRCLDCLLPDPGHMPQSLSSEVSDVHPAHLDSTESIGLLLGMGKRMPVKGDFAKYFPFQYAHCPSLCVAHAHTSPFVD